ncbi:MAG: sugar ABC transporter permease [Lachnospiraceae bacterium]|nr:sugar ABC transporter permease [Lachnospiraceae bacterium]
MAASVKKQPKKRMSRAARKEAITGYLYLLPNFIGFFIFTAIPIILGLLISFTDYNGFKWKFVGISNYLKMFGDSQFKAALVNNLVYSVVSVPLTIAFSLILALALNRKLFGGGFFKTVFFFPNLTSMVAIGCIAMLLFQPVDGPVNQALRAIGIAQEHLPKWFMSTKTALLTVIIVVVWKQAGYYMIMFMGGLKSIPNHLYEAAKIDGANSWKLFWHVTWPMLSPTTFMVDILCFIASFQVFDIINVTTQGGPGRSTSVLVFRIYKEAFGEWKMGYASAIAYFLFVIILIITLIQWKGQKNWVNED